MKKIILITLTLFSIFCLLAFSVSHENISTINNEINLNDVNKNICITKSGNYYITGSSKNISIIILTPGSVTLSFASVCMEATNQPCILVEEAQSVTLEFVENTQNTFISCGECAYDAAIYSCDNLTFTGNGAAVIQSSIGHGIKGNDSIQFLNGNYEISCTEDAIHANDNIVIQNGSFWLKTGDKGIRAEKDLELYNGVFDIQSTGDALRAETILNIHDGTYTIDSESEGLESKNKVVINNGFILINSKDDGINAISEIEINGGDLRIISSENDAIDSNGMIMINGGKIYASGFKSPEGAIDCDMGLLQINGGQIIGVGRMNSYYNVGAQNILLINPEEELYIRNIKIRQMSEILFEYTLHEYDETQEFSMGINIQPPTLKQFSHNRNLLGSSVSLFISFPKLTDGTYSIYLNDIFYSNVEISEKYTILGAEPVLRFPK